MSSSLSTTSSSEAASVSSRSNSCCSLEYPLPTNYKRRGDGVIHKAHSTLNCKQVHRLRRVLSENIEVHGLANFPSLVVQLRSLILAVHCKLKEAKIILNSTKLNGGAASHILAYQEDFPFCDLDLIFNVSLDDQCTSQEFDKIRDSVLQALLSLLPATTSRDKIDPNTVKDVYIRKMVKVCECSYDRWSLFTLNNNFGKCVELKFVDRMRRQFEFSVDSFQLTLDPLLGSISDSTTSLDSGIETTNKMSRANKCDVIVPAESMFGDFRAALRHLNECLIDTARPEEIRGGGLLKYCHLLSRGFKPARAYAKWRKTERYMCSRFFIDFPDANSQEQKLISYLHNHLNGGTNTTAQQLEFLHIMQRIVNESTVCLMSHERKQTLHMIQRLAYQINASCYYEHQCHQGVCTHEPRQTLLYMPRNAAYWIPVV